MLRISSPQSAHNRSPLQPPQLVVDQAQLLRCPAFNLNREQHIQDKALKEEVKTSVRGQPRNRCCQHPAPRALHSRHTRRKLVSNCQISN
jgi:hypothetical protein